MKPADPIVAPVIKLKTVVLDCRDTALLSDFYIRLLGWKRNYAEGDEWIDIAGSESGVRIGFQKNEDYVPPVWPEEPGAQQQMVHLDFCVQGRALMELAVRHALACGAVRAGVQYEPDSWVTMIDPEGHPFCFVVGD